MNIRRYKLRLSVVLSCFLFAVLIISFRVIYLQIFQQKKLKNFAANQHLLKIELDPARGAILDRNHRELALSLKSDSLYAVAREIKNKRGTAKLLAKVLDKDENFLYERLCRDKLFVWLARKISPDIADKVRSLKLEGISFIEEPKRFYPKGELASQLIGFAGVDNNGLEGIEFCYDKYLKGRKGYRINIRDAKGRDVFAFGEKILPPINGSDLILTIDEVIQHITENALQKACVDNHAKSGCCVVMSPKTGEILAMAVWPAYDVNDFSDISSDIKRNRAICDTYEPGSVFKVITAAACLDTGVVTENDRFFCENGSWYIRARTLHDHKGYGNLTFREVIEKSSNIGIVKAAMKLEEKRLYDYIKRFGFGECTKIDLYGEVSGKLRPFKNWDRCSITALPMGHEIAVTSIQIVSAVAAIANNGEMMQPYVVSKIVDPKGVIIKESYPKIKRRVISEETAILLKDIMRGVVENGTGKKAALENYTSAGKTGTSQKQDASGLYSHSKFIASFVGFAPIEDPLLSIAVIVDEPKPVYYGGQVAAPVFKTIADEVLRYLEKDL